jgi:hypothetical protein
VTNNDGSFNRRIKLSAPIAAVILMAAIYLPTLWCQLYEMKPSVSSPSVGGYRIELSPGWAPLQGKDDAGTHWFFLNTADKSAVAFIKDRFPLPLATHRMTVFANKTEGIANNFKQADYFSDAQAPFGKIRVLKRAHQTAVLGEAVDGEVVIVDGLGLTIHTESLEFLRDIRAITKVR